MSAQHTERMVVEVSYIKKLREESKAYRLRLKEALQLLSAAEAKLAAINQQTESSFTTAPASARGNLKQGASK